jgi:serine protease inhibitor
MHLLLVTVLVASAAGQPVAPVPPPELARADNRFGLEVFNQLLAARPQENVFISPLSIALALQMTMHGASGQTYDAMAGTLGVAGFERADVAAGNRALRDELAMSDKRIRLDIANSLWLRKGVKLNPQFVTDCGKYYDAAATSLDFAGADAVPTINGWVSKHTNGRIDKIVGQLRPEDFLVLVNAVYFKASWAKAFDSTLTAPRDFYLASGNTVRRRMMQRTAEFGYKSDLVMQAVALPYGDGRVSMYIFLPRDKAGLDRVMEGVETENVSALFDGFAMKKGDVVLPRFKLEFEQSLTKTLQALGMGLAFAPQASFSDMLQPPATARISDVLHKTFVEVNEEGTEAAAATGVVMTLTAMPPREEKFSLVCDHPFLCVIRDDATGAILFLGAVYDPKQ